MDRCEGEGNEVRSFSTFAPKAMNGRKLAGMDDMLTSRSVVIPMTRARKLLPELRADRDPVGDDLKRQSVGAGDGPVRYLDGEAHRIVEPHH